MELPKPVYELKPYLLIGLGVFALVSNPALWARICGCLAIVCGLAIIWVRDYRRKGKSQSRDKKKFG